MHIQYIYMYTVYIHMYMYQMIIHNIILRTIFLGLYIIIVNYIFLKIIKVYFSKQLRLLGNETLVQ